MKVLSIKNKVLFEGTKQECLKFIKKEQLSRNEFKLRDTYRTTAPIKAKGGFFKRIFNK